MYEITRAAIIETDARYKPKPPLGSAYELTRMAIIEGDLRKKGGRKGC